MGPEDGAPRSEVSSQCAALLLEELERLQSEKALLENRFETVAARTAQVRQQCKEEERRTCLASTLAAFAEEKADKAEEVRHAASGRRAEDLRRANGALRE